MDSLYLLEITKGHGKGTFVHAANEVVGNPILAFLTLRDAEESAIDQREYFGIIAKPVAMKITTTEEEKCLNDISPSTL